MVVLNLITYGAASLSTGESFHVRTFLSERAMGSAQGNVLSMATLGL